MKVYLFQYQDKFYLINEDFSKMCRPYFLSQPQRMLLLKERFNGDKVELLKSITNEELQQLVDKAILNWKIMLPYMVDTAGKLKGQCIAEAEVTR